MPEVVHLAVGGRTSLRIAAERWLTPDTASLHEEIVDGMLSGAVPQRELPGAGLARAQP